MSSVLHWSRGGYRGALTCERVEEGSGRGGMGRAREAQGGVWEGRVAYCECIGGCQVVVGEKM